MANCTSDKYKFTMFAIEKCGSQTMHAWYLCLENGWDFQEYRDKEIPLINKKLLKQNGKYNPDFYSFAVVRNPYSRLLSGYFDLIANPERNYYNPKFTTFKSWVMSLGRAHRARFDNHFRPMFIRLRGRRLDKICKLENLQEDMDEVCAHLCIPRQEMHDRKDGVRRYSKPYHEYYDEETIAKVMEIYGEDFDLLGYSRDLPTGESDDEHT